MHRADIVLDFIDLTLSRRETWTAVLELLLLALLVEKLKSRKMTVTLDNNYTLHIVPQS